MKWNGQSAVCWGFFMASGPGPPRLRGGGLTGTDSAQLKEGRMMSDMNSVSESRGNPQIMFFIAGAAIGAAVALLMAPYSWQETRRRLGETARRRQTNARDSMSRLKERIDQRAEHLRDAVNEGRDA